MARAKKSSLSQQLVGVGTTGMPAPVQKVLRGRLMSKLVILVIPVLFACGLLNLNWENGFPSFSVNREKVAEVKQEAAVRIDQYRHEGQAEHGMQINPLRSFGDNNHDSGFFNQPAGNPLLDANVAERIAEAPGKFFGELTHADAPSKPAAEPEKNSLFGNGPISNLKQRFQNR